MQRLNLWRAGSFAVGWLALVVCLFPAIAHAEIESGTITGIVTDETGGALPGAHDHRADLGNGQARTVVSNADGRYLVAALPPTKYSITAELSGFSTMKQPITVNVGAALDVNFPMKLGALEETVTVTGEAPLIESTKTGLSTVVTAELLESLHTETGTISTSPSCSRPPRRT